MPDEINTEIPLITVNTIAFPAKWTETYEYTLTPNIQPTNTFDKLSRPECKFETFGFIGSISFTPLKANGLIAYMAEWPSDGLSILYPGNDLSIPLHQLQNLNVKGRDIGPKWSPDGKQIAFIFTRYFEDGRNSISYLMIADLEEGKICPVTEGYYSADYYNDTISWSTDGKKIAWNNSMGYRKYELRILNLEDGQQNILTNDIVGHPAWIDGTQIAYIQGNFENTRRDLVIQSFNGEKIKIVIPWASRLSDFAYSPDGKWLAYTDGNLYIVNLYSGNIIKHLGNEETLLMYYSVIWSPDSQSLLIHGEACSNYLFKIDKPTNAPEPTICGFPSREPWAEDSKQFVFIYASDGSKETTMYINNIETGGQKKISIENKNPENPIWNKLKK
jgi:Tol biopolymer transport system component